ncbi:uncharacterized protein EI90DRAFT_3126019 [Cantharellus anzutake]|uniref:uncharacterized protein n=1 Tax=Cantharellus anzutake TaxID=1750568 RepID=UPI0019031867|nr:uncharacterized protein EI90DRAFT_3126019 [Cantharellus anzutake]KAF8328583.1 hypothetical protein EI90DRAFT_3126019 [Cantharellus anzutake]
MSCISWCDRALLTALSEDIIEIRENEFGWAYLDDQNGPYFRILHPMFLEGRSSPVKESRKVKVSLALEKAEDSEGSTGAIEHALPSKDFKFHVDVHAFDDNGLDVPCNGLDLLFTEGMAVISTVSLHFMRACNTTKGEIRSFQLNWTALQVVGQTKASATDPLAVSSSTKKCAADSELPGPVKKRGPFFTSGSMHGESSSHTLSHAGNGCTDNLVVKEEVDVEVRTVEKVEKGKGKEEDVFMSSITIGADVNLNGEAVKENGWDD